jgi:hypothetical protein
MELSELDNELNRLKLEDNHWKGKLQSHNSKTLTNIFLLDVLFNKKND